MREKVRLKGVGECLFVRKRNRETDKVVDSESREELEKVAMRVRGVSNRLRQIQKEIDGEEKSSREREKTEKRERKNERKRKKKERVTGTEREK